MNDAPQMHKPEIVTDGGPWALHDYACPVCQTNKAILDIGTGVFHPCSDCARKGWKLTQRRRWRVV